MFRNLEIVRLVWTSCHIWEPGSTGQFTLETELEARARASPCPDAPSLATVRGRWGRARGRHICRPTATTPRLSHERGQGRTAGASSGGRSGTSEAELPRRSGARLVSRGRREELCSSSLGATNTPRSLLFTTPTTISDPFPSSLPVFIVVLSPSFRPLPLSTGFKGGDALRQCHVLSSTIPGHCPPTPLPPASRPSP